MSFQLVKQIKGDDTLRKSFFHLALQTFGLSFESWYQQGFWTESYIPYTWVRDNQVLANASVNLMPFIYNGQPRFYIQIGTVMTHPQYRNFGLARSLIQEIIRDWNERSDAIYLFANDTVLDFYPKFGFQKAQEFQYKMSVVPKEGDFILLNMQNKRHQEEIHRLCQFPNPYSILSMYRQYGLLMFYCSSLFKDCVYYSPKYETVCIAAKVQDSFYWYDILRKPSPELSLQSLMAELAFPGVQEVILGFTPEDLTNCLCNPLTGEDTLFLLKDQENLFSQTKAMFPILSHA